MSRSRPIAQSPRVPSSEDFKARLESIITAIQRFPVDKRRRSSATAHVNSAPTTISLDGALEYSPKTRASTLPSQHEHFLVLLSPPQTPARAKQSPPSSPHIRPAMNRAPLHGAPLHGSRGQAPPPRGPRGAPPSYGPQDARSGRGTPTTYGSQDARGSPGALGTPQASRNVAVQPVINAGNSKLKKIAVKIMSAPAPSGAAKPTGSFSPVPEPVKAIPKEVESYETIKPLGEPSTSKDKESALEDSFARMTNTTSHSYEPIESLGKPRTSQEKEMALEDLFARLNAETTSIQEDVIRQEPSDGPPADQFVFESFHTAQDAPDPKLDAHVHPSVATVSPEEQQPGIAAITSEANEDSSRAELEQLYLRKAYDYLQALPAGNSVPVQILKTVSKKLRSSYAPTTNLPEEEIRKLQARYAFAIAKYVKTYDQKSTNFMTPDAAKIILEETNGDMLQIFSKLADEGHLSLADIDSSAGLCQTILDILPKVETTTTPLRAEIQPGATPTVTSPEQVSKEILDRMKVWPSQEKRENPAQHRVCILKGVSGVVKSNNELQVLVWGGRLESIQLPAPGSDFAVVRFLTPEACDKYFKATENGIELPSKDKKVIFVEKQPGPASINDVLRNCTEGDASRCVRALDAEEDWSLMLLTTLARGKDKLKRGIDCIKQGKTARGRHYIDFRFANIYHALSFKRQLMEDPDWEACRISFATDPCETAQGVHYEDADE